MPPDTPPYVVFPPGKAFGGLVEALLDGVVEYVKEFTATPPDENPVAVILNSPDDELPLPRVNQ